MDCGIQYNYWQMQMDHRPGEIKVDDVSQMPYKGYLPFEIYKEIDKCDVVCGNCHSNRTYYRKSSTVMQVTCRAS